MCLSTFSIKHFRGETRYFARPEKTCRFSIIFPQHFSPLIPVVRPAKTLLSMLPGIPWIKQAKTLKIQTFAKSMRWFPIGFSDVPMGSATQNRANLPWWTHFGSSPRMIFFPVGFWIMGCDKIRTQGWPSKRKFLRRYRRFEHAKT